MTNTGDIFKIVNVGGIWSVFDATFLFHFPTWDFPEIEKIMNIFEFWTQGRIILLLIAQAEIPLQPGSLVLNFGPVDGLQRGNKLRYPGYPFLGVGQRKIHIFSYNRSGFQVGAPLFVFLRSLHQAIAGTRAGCWGSFSAGLQTGTGIFLKIQRSFDTVGHSFLRAESALFPFFADHLEPGDPIFVVLLKLPLFLIHLHPESTQHESVFVEVSQLGHFAPFNLDAEVLYFFGQHYSKAVIV